MLNSRPLAKRETSDLWDALTPNDFLRDRVATLGTFKTKVSHLGARHRYLENTLKDLWTRFNREILLDYRSRGKWYLQLHEFKPGELVLVLDTGNPPGQWRVALVTKTQPGPDGLVRAVTIRTPTGEYDRGVHSLVPLPNQEEALDA